MYFYDTKTDAFDGDDREVLVHDTFEVMETIDEVIQRITEAWDEEGLFEYTDIIGDIYLLDIKANYTN